MSQKNPNPEKAADANRNVNMPTNLPLLSNVDPDRIALFAGRAGTFTRVERNLNETALMDMQIVVSIMEGQANTRNSIPDVRAQSLCFRYMLHNIADRNAAVQGVNRQWRGALCAYILSPLMQFFTPKGQSLQWHAIQASKLRSRNDALGTAIAESLNLPIFAAGVDWHLLTLGNENQQYPILDYSSTELAVPATVLPDGCGKMFPWLDEKGFFTDPIDDLSVEALELVVNWMNDHLETMEPDVRAAAVEFRNDAQRRLMDLRGEPPYPQVFETLLQALLLRDLVPANITVFSMARRVNQKRFEGAMAGALEDGSALRKWQAITDLFEYGVALDGQPVAMLSADRLLWIPAPGCLLRSVAFNRLRGTMQKALAGADIRQVLAVRVNALFGETFAFPDDLRARLLEMVNERSPGPNRIFHPEMRETARDEVLLLHVPFEMMSSVCGHRCSGNDPFTQALTVYSTGSDPLYETAKYNDWSAIHIARSTSFSSDGPAIANRSLLPLTVCGATVVRNTEMLGYPIHMELLQEKEQISAELRIHLDGATYEWKRVYEGETLRESEPPTSVPSVCTWPNAMTLANEPPWQLYYTYVHFAESLEPIRYTSHVFDVSGNSMTAASARVTRLQNPKGLHYAWQTHPTRRPPSFCTVEENNECIGCVLFAPATLFPAYQAEARLAVDFGTTSTTGAVMLNTRNAENITAPTFTQSVLKWEINRSTGMQWSLEQFIADRFNCQSRSENDDAFFTALARFSVVQAVESDENGEAASVRVATPGNKLFEDAHIYYFGNDFHDDNPMGNPRFFGLKLQDLQNPEEYAGSNVSMFLRQVIEMYLLYCRLRGSKVTEIRFAYPLAFSRERRAEYQRRVRELVLASAKKAGMEECVTSFTSESQAVGEYFCHIKNIRAGNLLQGIITLDVGGGTADYSYCRLQPDGEMLCDFYSNYFGGHRLVGEYVYQCKRLVEGGRKNALDWLYNGLREVEKDGSKEDRDDLEAFIKTLSEQNGDDKNSFVFSIERFISLKALLFEAALHTSPLLDMYMALLFQLTLMLWFAHLLGIQTWAKTEQNKVYIYIGGNGARLINMLLEADRELAKKVINDGESTALETLPSKHPKREVAEGLLKAETMPADAPSHLSGDAQSTPEKLWEKFAGLITRFTETFAGRNSNLIDTLNSMMKERYEETKDQFLRKNTTLGDVCAYLTEFCDIIMEDCFTPEHSNAEKRDTV